MAGDLARRYIEMMESLEDDDDFQTLNKLRALPIKAAEQWYMEALEDYLKGKLEE